MKKKTIKCKHKLEFLEITRGFDSVPFNAKIALCKNCLYAKQVHKKI